MSFRPKLRRQLEIHQLLHIPFKYASNNVEILPEIAKEISVELPQIPTHLPWPESSWSVFGIFGLPQSKF
jgi:hypothetical protein